MKVRITSHFHAFGSQFENIKVGQIYETVSAPEDFKNLSGVWVEGVGGEPIRLVPGEYTEL